MTSSTSAPDPAQQLTAQIDDLQRRVNDLQSGALLAAIKDELENLDTLVRQLPARLQDARAAGYAFGVDLEAKAAALKGQWPGLRAAAQTQLNQQAPALQAALRPVEAQLAQLSRQRANLAAARALAPQVDAAVDGLEAKIKAAQDALRGGYDKFRGEANALNTRLDQVKRMLQWQAEAVFKLLATEGLYAAVEAKWDRDGKDDPRGRLFLTDQRLLFERREAVATKKFLFIATEKEQVQELLLDVALGAVDEVKASKKGLLGHEDHLDFAFSADAPVRAAHFHIDGQDCHQWQALVGRARAGDFTRERAVQVDQAVVDRAASAPTHCPSCGGAFTAPVLRGQTEIKCPFCGTVTRF